MGWRMGDDLEVLAEIPDGQLSIDLLAGQTTHDSRGPITLHVADEIQAWLKSECKRESIPFAQIVKAELVVELDTSQVKTDKKRAVCFSFVCRSLIATDEHEYRAEAHETHNWLTEYP